ncbi:MAG: DNA-binding response regulator [Calditrichaeota bacterium]|nr:MAG: DNA-binding response regulator [Calditrichota bacterium]
MFKPFKNNILKEFPPMILLLSDTPERAQKIQTDLGNEGFPVEITDDVSEMLLRLRQNPRHYRVLLLDFNYTRADVLDICQQVKRDQALRSIPLVCLLDKSRVIDQLLAFEMGADDFIFMPYSPIEIQLKMRSLQRLNQLHQELQQKEAQLEYLRNIQRLVVTLNHYINNALTPLYFAVQIMDMEEEASLRLRSMVRDTVVFISKVLQAIQQLVEDGKLKVLQEGVYKDIMLDIEWELNELIEKKR